MTGTQEGFENGLTVEHILLSVTVVSNKESCGQFDDSCSHILEKALREYHGVTNVVSNVLYNHTRIDHHPDPCVCGFCKPFISPKA